MSNAVIRCEGWRRHGAAFSLGPVTWCQCKEKATIMLKVKQDGKIATLPSCVMCWTEAKVRGIKIIEANPINDCQPPKQKLPTTTTKKGYKK